MIILIVCPVSVPGDHSVPGHGGLSMPQAPPFTRAHIEQTKGTPADNNIYCSKYGNILIEQGELPHQGSRTDIYIYIYIYIYC